MNRKELDPETSPQAAYGARLRSLRDDRGWTQEELGERAGCSGAHISAVETGRRPPTLKFSKNLDRALGTRNATFENRWLELRKGSMLAGFPQYTGHEARAVEIRVYEIGVIPGLLQTPEYSQALAASAVQRGSITPVQAEERLSYLAERQESLTRLRPPMVYVVMDESCVRQQVGSPEIMAAQLERLEEFAALPNTMLQVAPFEMGERRPFDLPLYLLSMADRSMYAYAESQLQGFFEQESEFVLPLLTAYHQLQGEALSQGASMALIRQAMKGKIRE
ncbi:helix-turn-helix domain-containing protein [Streptomyces sp. JNUCC 64]